MFEFPKSGKQVIPLTMATNTDLLQAMADKMLPLFDGMPSVRVTVKDHSHFTNDRIIAFYQYPQIIVRPDYVSSLDTSFSKMRNALCHELIHAWEKWKGLDKMGEFLDEGHNEWFVKKALDINAQNIDAGSIHSRSLMPTAAKAHAGCAAKRRQAAAMFSAPQTRNNEMAVFLSAAITCGMCPTLTCERSSSKVTSRTQCNLFSMCQCSLHNFKSCAAVARSCESEVMPCTTSWRVAPVPLFVTVRLNSKTCRWPGKSV
jgi:hypothetical protein